MNMPALQQLDEFTWELPVHDNMNVPGILYGSREIITALDNATTAQLRDVASMPGIVRAAYAMPDAHMGYGFPIGGVAAFDPRDGVIVAGGVGYDIACGVRTLHTGLKRGEFMAKREEVADALLHAVPTGVGQGGKIKLGEDSLYDMLCNGASWAIERGYGTPADLAHIEESGKMPGADPDCVSEAAKKRMLNQMGTLGSGNHYLEIQCVDEILDEDKAQTFGLAEKDVLITIHCGSRGLGHQIATDYINEMAPKRKKKKKRKKGAPTVNRQMASAPINSELGQRYLAAMRAGINCALANRQVIGHLARQVFTDFFPNAELPLLYDVSHNTCKAEQHELDGKKRTLFVHRKGATRSYPPGHPDVPTDYASAGQPVLVGGSMGTPSYILAGTDEAMRRSFGSTCHGAGRALSRSAAKARQPGREVVSSLEHRGILVRSFSFKSIAEEAPEAYKDIDKVIHSAAGAGLSVPVAKLTPLACVKG